MYVNPNLFIDDRFLLGRKGIPVQPRLIQANAG
jgi:hypothetical protein